MKPTKYAKLFNLNIDRKDLLENMERIKDIKIKPIKGDV